MNENFKNGSIEHFLKKILCAQLIKKRTKRTSTYIQQGLQIEISFWYLKNTFFNFLKTLFERVHGTELRKQIVKCMSAKNFTFFKR
jgi:hypothetical protein